LGADSRGSARDELRAGGGWRGKMRNAAYSRAEAQGWGASPRVGVGYQMWCQYSVSAIESSANGLKSQCNKQDFSVKSVHRRLWEAWRNSCVRSQQLVSEFGVLVNKASQTRVRDRHRVVHYVATGDDLRVFCVSPLISAVLAGLLRSGRQLTRNCGVRS